MRGVIRGPINAEDLVRVPGSPWVITTGMRGPTVPHGRLYAIDIRDGSCSELYPYHSRVDHDASTYGDDCAPIDPADFEPHGIDVGPDASGDLCVYVVHHGVRESVEIFRLEVTRDRPRVAWVGGLRLPAGCWGNDVAVTDDGVLYVTSTTDISLGLEDGFARSLAGEETGKVVRWSTPAGWEDVPGSTMNSTNGVAVSDTHLYIGGWRPQNVVRIEFGTDNPAIETAPTGIMTDNLTWADDGRLLTAGAHDTPLEEYTTHFWGAEPQCRFRTQVVAIDPHTMTTSILVEYAAGDFGVGCTAIQVGDEIWVGSMRGEGVARFAL